MGTKNVLVVGGSYFLGRVFVEELLKREGFAVTVVNRGKLPLKRKQVTEVVCDRHEVGRMKSLLSDSGWDAIVDFCAYDPGDISEIFQAGIAGKSTQYVLVSTASVYASSGQTPLKEDAPKLSGPQPKLGPFADYAYNKWRVERELTDACGEMDSIWTIIRPAFIYGKFNYAPRESYFFDIILRGKEVIIPEPPHYRFSFVSVWDTARIIIECLENEASCGKAFNAAAEEQVSYPVLMDIFREVTGIPFEIESRSVEEITAGNIPLPFPLDEHLLYDGTLARETLGLRYTPFLEGMKETYRFYRIGRGLGD